MTHDNNIGATTVAIGKALDFSEEYTPAHEWREGLIKKFIANYPYSKWGIDAQDGLHNDLTNLLTTHSAHLVEREKQLKQVHTMELDAISCMSIEQFVVWRDYRKQRPALDQAIDIIKDNK